MRQMGRCFKTMFIITAFVMICNFATLCRHDDRLIISLVQIGNDEETEFFLTIGKECDKRRRRKNIIRR